VSAYDNKYVNCIILFLMEWGSVKLIKKNYPHIALSSQVQALAFLTALPFIIIACTTFNLLRQHLHWHPGFGIHIQKLPHCLL